MWSSSWWHQVPLPRVVLALFTFFTPGRENNPLQETVLLRWKDCPSDTVSRDLAEALVGTIPCSGALLGLCWGPLGPCITPPHRWGLPSPLPQLHWLTMFIPCLLFPSTRAPPGDTVLCPLPPRLVSSIWERSAEFHLHIDRGFMAASAWLTGCTSSGFPLSIFFCLTVDGKRSQSASPFPFQLFPSKKTLACQTARQHTTEILPHIASFFLFFTSRAKEVGDRFPVEEGGNYAEHCYCDLSVFYTWAGRGPAVRH